MCKKLTISDCRVAGEKSGFRLISTEYVNANEKLDWVCGENHAFKMSVNKIKSRGSGCPHCSRRARLSLEDAKNEASRRGGKCVSTEYRNGRQKLDWVCGKGHAWKATIESIRHAKSWCPVCSGNLDVSPLDTAAKIAESRGGKCLSSTYVKSSAKLLWECKAGHKWEASLNLVKRKTWCPECSKKPTVSEDFVRETLENMYPGHLFPNTRPEWLCGLELDGYCEELGVAFEHQGVQHYRPLDFFGGEKAFDGIKERDKRKREACKKHGIKLVEVPAIGVFLKKDELREFLAGSLAGFLV